ncbi:MAG TPA: 4-hydroxy-tetrahydrodipicolinate synthase [Acidimicrobiales bacterium]|nr:4-hydroxy-tetrahydrodipicolinate synthase [Acidimicrobiales bacterium]
MPISAGPGRFGAVITAMVTPFDDEGALDVDGAVTLARWLTSHGSDGLVVAGTTGEGPVLDDDELGTLWRAVSEAVTVPVIAGTGSADTAHTVACTRLAAQAGAAAALVVTPYYSRPSQAGLAAHFRAVADATDLPVLLYDIPVRTGRKIAHETMLGLARQVPTIVGVKDAAGDVVASARLVAEAPPGFELYSGDDAVTLPLLAVGAVGLVSVAAHWAGDELGAMIAAFGKGDVEGARLANAALLDSYAFESSEATPNPLPAKAACRALGLPAGQCRLPLGVAPPELDAAARAILAGLGRPVGGTEAGGPLA